MNPFQLVPSDSSLRRAIELEDQKIKERHRAKFLGHPTADNACMGCATAIPAGGDFCRICELKKVLGI